jgi:hypothetical protein
VKISKSANKKILHEAFGEHSSCWTAVSKGINVSRPVECQLKMTNIQDDQARAKWRKMQNKFKNSSTTTITGINSVIIFLFFL